MKLFADIRMPPLIQKVVFVILLVANPIQPEVSELMPGVFL